jgi:hypothetical protein
VGKAGRGLRGKRPDAARVRHRARDLVQQPSQLALQLRKESRPLELEPPKVPGQAPELAPAAEGSRLLPVRVVASASKTRTTVVAGARDELLEIALPSGVRVRFPVGTDPKYLRALTAAL